MQKEILEKHPDPSLRVYTVWFSMVKSDARDKWDPGLLHDSRITHFWDEERVVGRFFGTHSPRETPPKSGVEWDAFFVYGPEARWPKKEAPGPLLGFGRPIRGHREKLRAAIVPLLEPSAGDASPAAEPADSPSSK